MSRVNMNIELLNQSMKISQTIANKSANLSDANFTVADHYRARNDFWSNLLGEGMHTSFTPFVTPKIVDRFEEHLKDAKNVLNQTIHWEGDATEEDRENARHAHILACYLSKYITTEHLLANKVPDEMKSVIESNGIKGYNSPRLSRMLVRMLGEGSNMVKWFTNDCPKSLTAGLNEDYKIYVTTLPHHIVGMSYYAPLNHGGDRWLEGWEGTSCVDPIMNSEGDGIYTLIPSVMDETLAVAYLTKVEDDDIMSPIMTARVLVRMIELECGKRIMMTCRPFFVTHEHTHILLEGLKARFHNLYTAQEVRDEFTSEGRVVSVSMDIPTTVYVRDSKDTCGSCDDGTDEDGDNCIYCDGTGEVNDGESRHYMPYIDDEDIIEFNENFIQFRLPQRFLEKYNLVELIPA